jgi:hypothetical protein
LSFSSGLAEARQWSSDGPKVAYWWFDGGSKVIQDGLVVVQQWLDACFVVVQQWSNSLTMGNSNSENYL